MTCSHTEKRRGGLFSASEADLLIKRNDRGKVKIRAARKF